MSSVFTLSHLYHVIYKCRYSGLEKARYLVEVIPVRGLISAVSKQDLILPSCLGNLSALFSIEPKSPNC